MSRRYAAALGARLRAVRRQHGMTLQQVHQRSGNRWSTVVLGSYERTDRAVSVTTLTSSPRSTACAPKTCCPPNPHPPNRTTPTGNSPSTRAHPHIAQPARRAAGPLHSGHPTPTPEPHRRCADHPRPGPASTGRHLRHRPIPATTRPERGCCSFSPGRTSTAELRRRGSNRR